MVVLKLKETARTMLLQIKVQSAFNGADEKLTKETLTQLVKAHHSEHAFCDEAELELFAAEAWDAQPGGAGFVEYGGFKAWYADFLEMIERHKANPTSWASRTGNDPGGDGAAFESDGPWSVPMSRLQDALEAAWAKGLSLIHI